jgi:cell division protein FtsL
MAGTECNKQMYLKVSRGPNMSKSNQPRKRTLSEKIFYVISLLIIFSMVISLVYVAFAPAVGF